MLSGLGFYILFIFKLFLVGVLSLIINYLYRNNLKDSQDLKIYTMISLIAVSLVSVANHYSSNNQVEILSFIILSLFAIFLALFFVQKIPSKGFMQCLLLFSISIFIGLGYYISSISLVVVFFIIDYFLEGVFDFFIGDDKDRIHEGKDVIEDIEDIDVDIIDED